jgi:hypothetical protein
VGAGVAEHGTHAFAPDVCLRRALRRIAGWHGLRAGCGDGLHTLDVQDDCRSAHARDGSVDRGCGWRRSAGFLR